MFLSRHPRQLWPFGLLVLAWFCASLPHSSGVEFFAWLKGAEHFSHQQRLMAETLAVLNPSKTPETQSYVKVGQLGQKHPATVPAAGTIKIELLFAEDNGVFVGRGLSKEEYSEEVSGFPEAFEGDTPHPPPRSSV